MKNTKGKVVRGDIFETAHNRGYGYVQYVGKHPIYGETILVSPSLYEAKQADVAKIFSAGYFTFYPISHAFREGAFVRLVNAEAPGLPKKWRRAGAIVKDKVVSWIIENDGIDTVKKTLSEEDSHLPIADIWNHEYLLNRLSQGWIPSNER